MVTKTASHLRCAREAKDRKRLLRLQLQVDPSLTVPQHLIDRVDERIVVRTLTGARKVGQARKRARRSVRLPTERMTRSSMKMPSRNSWLERAIQMLSASNYVIAVDHTLAVVYATATNEKVT